MAAQIKNSVRLINTSGLLAEYNPVVPKIGRTSEEIRRTLQNTSKKDLAFARFNPKK